MKVFGVSSGIGRLLLAVFSGFLVQDALAYPSVLGDEQTVEAKYEDTFADLAEKFHLGFEELVQANPKTDPWIPEPGQPIIIPTRHIVPPGPRQGILINLSEYRLYYFRDSGKLESFPIGIGTVEFPTPIIDTHVIARLEKPAWYPPASIRARHLEEEGEPMPHVVPPGPDNPLGPFAIKLEADGYLIHGTNKKMGIGMAVSHGCIRMYNPDINRLIHSVSNRTPVKIVREPVKAALVEGQLWAEYHPDVEVPFASVSASLSEQISQLTRRESDWKIDQSAIRRLLREGHGRPVLIGIRENERDVAAR